MYREEKQTLAGIPLARIEEDIVNILRRKYLSTEVNKKKPNAIPQFSSCYLECLG